MERFLERNWCKLLSLVLLLTCAPVFIVIADVNGLPVFGGADVGFGNSRKDRKVEYAVPPNPVCPEVDLVYTWVNGTDPAIGEAIAKYTGQPYVESGRLRDIPTLRYSIRAADTYAPWIRQVVIVTNGQVPTWLNRSNPRVRIVTHSQIFRNVSDLPTWNSNAIEAMLVNIPGIAPCWFYLNDDFSFASPVSLGDFLDLKTGKQKLAFDLWMAPEVEHMKRNLWHRSVGFSNALLNRRYHPNEPDDKRRHYYEGHNVRLFRQSVLESMQVPWRREWDETAKHKFRTGEDTALPFLYNNVVLEEFGGTPSDALKNALVYGNFFSDSKSVRRTLERFRNDGALAFCLNDAAGVVNTPEQQHRYDSAVTALVQYFEEWFPLPSDIEAVLPGERTIPRAPHVPGKSSAAAEVVPQAQSIGWPEIMKLIILSWLAATCYLLYAMVSQCIGQDKAHVVIGGSERDLDV